ncbi:MAG: BON domain-containing protein [Rubrivivax sp.]|nr:BON domain-containing protein [Rubrivivax sp.]
MKSMNRFVLPVLVASTALFGACTRNQQGEARQAGRDVGESTQRMADAAGSKAKDVGITTQVKSALMADSVIGGLKIDVDTHNGRVTLRGNAPDAAARDKAGELAKGIEGVSGVDNQLLIQPNR